MCRLHSEFNTEEIMTIGQSLLPEFDQEMQKNVDTMIRALVTEG